MQAVCWYPFVLLVGEGHCEIAVGFAVQFRDCEIAVGFAVQHHFKPP